MHIVCIHIHTYLYLITTYLYIFTIYISYIHIYIYMHMHAHPPTGPTLFPLFHWMFYCNVNHFAICRLLHTKKQKNNKYVYLGFGGNPKKQKNTDTHTNQKKKKQQCIWGPTPPPSPNSKVCLLKLPIVFISQNGYPSFFFGFLPPNPKQITQTVDISGVGVMWWAKNLNMLCVWLYLRH